MDILVERANGVLTIAFNRPDKKNAITAAMYQTMADALVEAQGDASVRAILFRGRGISFHIGLEKGLGLARLGRHLVQYIDRFLMFGLAHGHAPRGVMTVLPSSVRVGRPISSRNM